MQLIASILYLALLLYTLVLLARLVLDWIRSYARDFRPRGIVLLLFEIVFSLTDPPVRTLRRVIPPLRLGGFSLDLSLLILLLVCSLLMRVLWGIAIG